MDNSMCNTDSDSPKFIKRKRAILNESSPLNSSTKFKSNRKRLSFVATSHNESPILMSESAMMIDEDTSSSCDSGFSDSSKDLADFLHFSSVAVPSSIAEDTNDTIDSSFEIFTNSSPMRTRSASDFGINKHRDLIFHKSKSSSNLGQYNEPAIMQALDNHAQTCTNENRLVGDMTKTHVLPLLAQSKHTDLASISPDTLADLLNGKYDDQIEQFFIFDARFPYEYQGGHIDSAENVYLKEDLFKRLLTTPIKSTQSGKRIVLIFHCEFSSERGPRLMREIRERDRLLNQHNYPQLYYPELYLLEGGYKNFFYTQQQLCAPRSYLPMLHDEHKNDLKYFRRKSKTWELETRKRIKSKLSF